MHLISFKGKLKEAVAARKKTQEDLNVARAEYLTSTAFSDGDKARVAKNSLVNAEADLDTAQKTGDKKATDEQTFNIGVLKQQVTDFEASAAKQTAAA